MSAAIVSGLLLWLAFPPAAQAETAFFAMVPLLLALRHAAPRDGFRLGWLAGVTFWLGNLAWFWRLKDNGGPMPLVLLGYAGLAAYCALYMGLFSLAVAWIWRHPRVETSPWLRIPAVLVVTPLLWVATEYLRGTLLTGFAWNSLGVSQYRNLPLIQCAAWGGTGAVSALLVAFNGGIAVFIGRTCDNFAGKRRSAALPGDPGSRCPAPSSRPRLYAPRSVELALALALCAFCWVRGLDRVRRLERLSAAAPQWRLVLFHAEQPSIFERSDESLADDFEMLTDHARLAASAAPDLCVWPETMLPGAMPFDPVARLLVSNVTAVTGAPLIAGALQIEPGPGWEWQVGARYYNAAYLIGSDGAPETVYRKQHLVPFGEYIPLDRQFPALARLSPIGYSCTPGEAGALMEVQSRNNSARPPLRLGPLICFEDTLPYLPRRAAQAGATLLVNLTNDAWFEGSSEGEQHLAQAVMRCVETGLPMVRSSNSGVTCSILANGRIDQRLGGGTGGGGPGLLFDDTGIIGAPEPTKFLRYGDLVLCYSGISLFFLAFAGMAIEARRQRAGSRS